MGIQKYLEGVGQWALTSGLQIVLVIVLAAMALKIVNLTVQKFFRLKQEEDDVELQKRADTLRSMFRSTVRLVVLILAGMMVLEKLGIEIGPVLAAAGVLGLAVGFGAQKLIEDVIGGFFIFLEDQIRVGDVVQIGDKSGLVEQINMRMTVLRDLAGNVHYIRNGGIGVVTNMTKDFSMYVFDIGVAYREDTDEVVEAIKRVDEGLRKDPVFKDDILAPIEIFGVDKFADSAVIIKARTKTRPIKQWGVAREFNRRLKKQFDELGIEIPFPHTTLYMGQDKKGGAPALNVRIDKKG